MFIILKVSHGHSNQLGYRKSLSPGRRVFNSEYIVQFYKKVDEDFTRIILSNDEKVGVEEDSQYIFDMLNE
jgi:hypothetical protein